MAGLLDSIGGLMGTSFDDPKATATLRLAQGLLTSPKAMQGLSGGLLGYQEAMQEAKKRQAMEQMQAMQMQQQQMALAQAQRQAQQLQMQDQFRQSIPSPQMQASDGKIPAVDPNAQLMHGALQAGLIDPVAYIASQRKDTTPIKLGAGEGLFDPKTYQPIALNPKEDSKPSALKEYEFAKNQGYGGSFLDFQLAQKRAGATSIKVDTGPKAFDTEMGKYAAESFGQQRDSAKAAAGVIQSIGEIKNAVKSGAYQGAGAELKLGAAKALGAIGMPYDAKTVANTELFSAQANQFVLNSIKTLGANPSNADREFIEKTVPRLQTDPAALPALLDFMERKARKQVQDFNTSAQGVKSRAGYLPFDLSVPESPTSSGVDDLVNKYRSK